METFEDKLACLEVAIRTPAMRELLPPGLGEWACASLRELSNIRAAREKLPESLAKSLRNQRILAAVDLIEPQPSGALARTLHDQGCALARAWPTLQRFDLGADTVRGNLHAANGWYALPSVRTYARLVTKQG